MLCCLRTALSHIQKRVHELKGRRLDAKAAVPKAHLGTAKLTKKMFVGGTGELTDADFLEHFSQYGEIDDAAVCVGAHALGGGCVGGRYRGGSLNCL